METYDDVCIQFQSQQAYTAAAAAAAGQQQGYYNQMGYWGYPQGYQPPAAGMQGYGMQPYAATAMQQGGYATAGYGGMPVQVRTYCKSLIFSVPLYLANLANLTFSLIFKDAKLKRRQQYFFYTKISMLPSRLNKCK